MLLKRLRRARRHVSDPTVEAEEAQAPAAQPTRRRFATVRRWLRRSKLTEADWDELEEVLIAADLGPHAGHGVAWTSCARRSERTGPPIPRRLGHCWLLVCARSWAGATRSSPAVRRHRWCLWSGSTGQAKRRQSPNWRTLLASIERAAKSCWRPATLFALGAIDQLQIWGDRVGVPVIAHQPGGDPGAVIYDALDAAQARGADYVIADSAGRQHTNVNLMNELAKMRRVAVAQGVPGRRTRCCSCWTR